MKGQTYKVGIVGLTGITMGTPGQAPPPLGNRIITGHMACLDLMPRVEVAGVCDLSSELQDRFKRDWGARWPDARVYTDYREMLDTEDIDILTVATGDDKHTDIVVAGASTGVRGIFCEKPLATSLEDADRMIQACEDGDIPLTVGHTRRWGPVYHKVREAIRTDAIGPVSTIVATRGGPRAMLLRNGTHLIDAICFFAGSEPAKTSAHLEDGFDDWDIYRGDGGKLPENEPSANGYVLFQNGVRAVLSLNKQTPNIGTVEIAGPKGKIAFNIHGGSAEMTTLDPDGRRSVLSGRIVSDQYQRMGYVAAYEELIDLIENGGEGISSGKAARQTLQILMGFLKSHQQGSSLVDVPG